MLRVSVARARPGMVLGRAIYDLRGQPVLQKGSRLSEENVGLVVRSGVGELLIEDPRVADVPVAALYPTDLEARVVKSLHVLLISKQGTTDGISSADLAAVQPGAHEMAGHLFPVPMGDPDLSGTGSLQSYDYLHPVQVAAVAMLIGREAGLDKQSLGQLGIAAVLQNVGYLCLPPGVLEKEGTFSEQDWAHVKKHPQFGGELLAGSGLNPEIIHAVQQHHERWNGSGYPLGRKGEEISLWARIVGITDTYHSLLCRRPHRAAFKPHEAMEFIVAYSGDLFDPELARIFARRIPQYPAGLGVKLNTGQVAIVSDANVGHIARPIVRIVSYNGQAVKPHDLDLSLHENMHILIVEVIL